jgi:hypothetical protein
MWLSLVVAVAARLITTSTHKAVVAAQAVIVRP